MELPFRFDVLFIDLKLSVGLMECLMTETEDVIQLSLKEFSKSEPKYHVFEYDDDQPGDEYYSHKDFFSRDLDEIEEMYTSTLPTMMRRSVFLTIYSILEFNTSKFCKGKIEAIQFPLKIDELNGRGMKRCIIFLEKILKLKHSETINRLNTMGKVRDLCIHNNGVINNEDKTRVTQLIKLSKGSLSIQNDTLVFNEGSIKFFIDIIRQFFNEIESALNN